MKNYYNNWLRGGSTLRQTGQGSAKSNTMWRNVAMILCVLMLGVGNVLGAGTAISSLNFNAPGTLPSNYTYSSKNSPSIATFQSISSVNICDGGGSTAPDTWSATNATAPSGGKRYMAFQPAVDCRVTIKVAGANNSRVFYLLDKDHTSTSSYVSNYTIAAKDTWYDSWSISLTNSTWYAIIGSGSNCYIASMQFVANPTFSESAGAELTAETDAVTLTSAGTTIYYKWSTSSSAYAANAGSTLAGAADGSGTSPVDATAPDGTGTYYLYAVAKSGNYYSDVVKRSYTITAAAVGPTLGSYYYRGSDNEWGATQMYLSTGELYEYYEATSSTNTFKIAASSSGWDYNDSYIKSGYCMTNLSVASDGTNDHNSKITSAPASYYIIVFKPSTRLNRSLSPIICASSTLPDDSSEGLAATKTIYLKPGTNWSGSSAKFAINYNGHGVTADHEWSSFMTLAPCETDVYKVDIPALYSNIIICRINSDAVSLTTGDFSKRWNQTADLVIPQGSDYFTVANDAWDGSTTTWSTYSAPTYTVTYNANGDGAGNATGTTGSVPTDASSPYACGSTVTVLGNTGSLAKSGYTFAGWNTAPGGGGTSYVADATFTISANTTLYAQWEEIKYTVTYNVNGGGSVTPTSATQASSGASVTLPTPTWSGYTFDGWYNAGTKIGNAGASYIPTADITLYAHWTDNISGKVFSFIDNNYGDKFKSFTGYGWVARDSTGRNKTFTNASTGVQYTISAGCWDKKDNAISALAKFKGGTSSMSIVIPTGKIATVKISYNAYGTAEDYRLTVNGSAQAAPSTKLADGNTNAQVISNMKEITLNNQTGTLTLGISNTSKNNYIGRVSAVITGYTVSYAAGTYGTGSLASGTKTHGSNFTLSSADDAFTRDGYVYDGWSVNADGSTKDYNLGGSYTTDAAITLYPHWVAACTAPSALAASSPTAKGVTLTVTDGEDTENYEFYVSEDEDEPAANATATHSVSSAKSLTITNLVAGTTYYAWARSVCGVSNKSSWVALTDDTFTTLTVGASYTLTNVTKSSGATTGIGGSDFTAVFAGATDYNIPSTITVTIDGNTATSGTDYTWAQATGTLTIPANKINGNITVTVNSAAAAPTNVSISGTYHYYPGETISLTATATGGNGPKTYQWYHGGTADGNAIDGATSATYSKSKCVVGDAGSYYCKVTCGGSASRFSDGANQDPFKVKIMQFYLKDASGDDISNHALVKGVDADHASLSLSLTGGTTYKFRVTDGCGDWYGNSGEMTSSNCTDWAMDADADCRITTSSKSATYTFNFDFTDGLLGSEMKVSVVYPAGNQASGKVIYWDNSVLEWASAPWYRIGKSTHNTKTEMDRVPGTANLYTVTTAEYNGFEYWHIANNQGQGTGNIFWTKDNSEGSPDEITNAMGFEGSPVTADAITVTPSTSHGTGGSSDNNNCEFYEYGMQNGMKTDRVTISSYSNGTITVNYVDTDDEEATLTSGYADLAHTVILTSITATPATGYTIDDPLTINEDDYEANYVVTGATTIAASFKPATYTVTLNTNSGTINAGNITEYTYLTGATLPTNVTRDGYRFQGWYADAEFSGDRVYTIGTSEYGNKEYWAKWAQLYTITNGSPANGTITVVASAIAGETVDISAAANTGYVFDAWDVYKTGTPATKVSPAAATASTNFTMPAYDVTVDASFVVKTYSLSYSIGTGATGAASGGTAAGSYAEGTTITAPAKGTLAKDGYTFRGWKYNGTFYLPTQSFSMPAANVTVTAVWEPNTIPATTLFSVDFTESKWSSVSFNQGNTETADVLYGITFYSKSDSKQFSISSSRLLWPDNNIASSNYFLAIPVSNVNGSITVTVTMDAVSKKSANVKYVVKDGETSVSTPGGTGTQATGTAGEGTVSFTVDLSNANKKAVVYLGRYNGNTENTNVKSITITTPGTPSHFDVAFKDGETAPASHTTWPDDIEGIESGLKILAPADPTAANYTFDDWYTSANCTTKVNYSTMTISADTKIYAKWYAHTRITTQPATSVDGLTNESYTLGSGMVAVGENLEYQWYTCDENGENLDDIDGKTSSTMTDTKTSAGSYYYIVKVSGDYGDDVYSDMITVEVVDPCFRFSCSSQSSSISAISSGGAITTSSWESGKAKLTGGTMKNSSSGSLNVNKTYGLVMESSKEVTVTLADGSALDVGSVITLSAGVSDASGSQTSGLVVSGNACTPASYTSSTAGAPFTQTYTVTALDGLAGTNSFTIAMKSDLTKTYLNGITVTGCQSCTAIKPTLSYSATTLYANGGTPRQAVPTLGGNTGSGAVTWTSSDENVVTVNSSGVVTAVGAGTATVTATIAATGEYCGASKSVEFTIPALVQQTINLNSAWSTVPNMTFPGDPTSTLTKNANIAATGYSIDESNNKSGLSSKIYGVPSSTSKDDSYYMSLSFNTPSHPARLTSVVVPIQPITNSASAIVTVSDGTTTVTSNEVADIADSKKKTCTFTITPTVFAADKTITVKIFVYDQTGDKGFRLGSPILVNGAVLVDQKFTGAGNWSDPANWDSGSLPDIYHDVVLEKAVTVDIAHATAKSIVIYNDGDTKTGKLTIQPNKGLEVAGTIRKTADGSSYSATGEADLVLESSSAGNASLIFNNSNSCQATVQMYSKAGIDGSTWNWQYVGTPFTGSIPQYNYYGSWMYKWNNGGWSVVKGSDELTPFVGYCLTQESATTHVMGGTLVPTTSKSITMAASTDMVLANSWTAPIYIGAFTTGVGGTFTSTPANIYLYNTGMAESGATAYDGSKEAGTYVTVPVAAAKYTGDSLIAPMQGFFVTTNGVGGAEGKITMNYDDLVRPADSRGIVAGPMKAPRRAQAADSKPAVLKMWANGSEYNDRVVILERADFSEGFDNGWDGKKMSFGSESPSVYVINEQGGYDAVSAIPSFEGTVVGFRAGADNSCTLTFDYDGEETLYLNDLKEQKSTLIDKAQTYTFSTSSYDSEARFIISATPITKITTGIENDANDANDGMMKVRKIIINDKLFIIRGGRMYDATGVMVK